MKLDIDNLNDEVLNSILKNLGWNPDKDSDEKMEALHEDVANMSVKEAFDRYCEWNGLLGSWGGTLIKTLDNIRASEVTATFNSVYRKMWNHSPLEFPKFSGTRIMMMPVVLGYPDGVPPQYYDLIMELYEHVESRFKAKIGYLTIDEQKLEPNTTLRRGGLHVDGYYHGRCGAWGGGGGWGSVGNGMLTISSTPHCKGYLGVIKGTPGPEGECDHLIMPHGSGEIFEAGHVYWVDGACVHESLPVHKKTKRQFVRLSMPNNGPWFEGYTKNPYGVQPTGPILPARDKFMKS